MLNKQQLHLIEPTLFDQTGHGYSYTQALIKANKGLYNISAWIDRRGNRLLDQFGANTRAHFHRPLRQIQKIFLYRRLIRQPGIIFVCTSELWDMRLLAHMLKQKYAKATVILHFHQFNPKPKKLLALKNIANSNPKLPIFTPTHRLQAFFIQYGFTNCQVTPCPTYMPNLSADSGLGRFDKVLYAGAARNDKGFPRVIDLLAYMREHGDQTNFEIQVSPPNSLRYDAESAQALRVLQNLPQDNLILHDKTLSQQQYQSLFKNSICLLIYNHNDYRDKFSGIALDAFYAGCPIITTKDTWMGDMVELFDAGITLQEYSNALLTAAIEQIRNNYEYYRKNSLTAAKELARLHDPINTINLIKEIAS